MDCSVVTCVTGYFNKLHKTDVEKAFVYTTLKDTEFIEHANFNGWEVKELPFKHSYDLREGTRQSKYVKFLKFHNPKTKYVIYVDHKYIIKKKHIPLLIEVIGDNAFLSFRNPSSIYEELYHSLGYERYRNDLNEMRRSISDHRNEGFQSLDLFYGGLMVYNTEHERFPVIKKKMEESVEKYNHVQDQLLFPLALKDEPKILINNTINLSHSHPQDPVPGETY